MQYAYKQQACPANYYKVTDSTVADEALQDLFDLAQGSYPGSVLTLKNDALDWDMPICYDLEQDEFVTAMFGSVVMRRDIQDFIGEGCIWELYIN